MVRALFVCLHNAGRSQMSEALFARGAEGRHEARSAGTTPAERVHPEVGPVPEADPPARPEPGAVLDVDVLPAGVEHPRREQGPQPPGRPAARARGPRQVPGERVAGADIARVRAGEPA